MPYLNQGGSGAEKRILRKNFARICAHQSTFYFPVRFSRDPEGVGGSKFEEL